MKVKAKRATRDPENDDGHNAQNHMKQGGGGESADTESERETPKGPERERERERERKRQGHISI